MATSDLPQAGEDILIHRLPPSLTKVTKLSKLLALLLFILLPFIGFYAGMQYQQRQQPPASLTQPNIPNSDVQISLNQTTYASTATIQATITNHRGTQIWIRNLCPVPFTIITPEGEEISPNTVDCKITPESVLPTQQSMPISIPLSIYGQLPLGDYQLKLFYSIVDFTKAGQKVQYFPVISPVFTITNSTAQCQTGADCAPDQFCNHSYVCPKEAITPPLLSQDVPSDIAYYQFLRDQCNNDGCCLSSLETMEANGYKLAGNGTCAEGFERDGLLCIDSYQWCKPVNENNVRAFCGDGMCQEVVCTAIGCPKPETSIDCPQDCQ